jgi:AICAR transformylase/IMP cyclohydrolase PurH
VPPAQTSAAPDPDLQVVLAEPDFTLSALPTTLRMPAHKLSFRLTHRFTRPIASGSFGDFFADLFGFDSSAMVGLELRYGIRPGLQATVHRTNDRSIQFLGQWQVLGQSSSRFFSLDALVATEGLNNFSEEFSGSVGAIVSHKFAEHGAVYVEPIFVSNSNTDAVPVTTDNNTMMIGVGARYRIGSGRSYVTAEASPRVAGYDVGVDHVSFGIEHRIGGHVFQFNISNSFATTMRQIARGGVNSSDWYVGFNLTRRFY